MTVLDPRPWSPASPHIGPDEEDLELLTPTGDPEEDLGSAILVVHRVGAAACETVARAPLPDEFRLVDALATARGALAAHAVGAVSKCVSTERPEVYADLLMRDVFDAGELGAVTVYRSCVAKGVAPPLAAQRAGLVYGVPQEQIGRYLAIASDPKSHPVAIADAADRAIAKWASSLVRDEMEIQAEPVSKQQVQTLDQYNQTLFGREHPKDAEGRFSAISQRRRPALLERGGVLAPQATQVAGKPVGILAGLRRNGGGGQAAPAELLAEVEAPPITQPPRVKRQIRQTRQLRETRQTHAEVKAEVRAGVKASITSRTTAKLAPKVQARIDAQVAGGTEYTGVDFSKPVDTAEQFGVIDDIPIAWAMSGAQAEELFGRAPGKGTWNEPKNVVIGNLFGNESDQGGLGEAYQWDHRDHTSMMRRFADQVDNGMDYRQIKLTAEELQRGGVPALDDPDAMALEVIKYAQRSGKMDVLSMDRGFTNPFAKDYITPVPSAEPNSKDWYLVRSPETEVLQEGSDTEPLAAEFMIWDDNANVRGNIEGSPSQPTYELDPNQRYIINPKRVMWKSTGERSGYWVHRYLLQPVESWQGGKAASVLAEPQIAWQTERRDTSGRWTKGGVLAGLRPETPVHITPDMTPAQVRQQRKLRQTRQVRQVAAAPTRAAVHAETHVELRPEMRAALEAMLERRAAVAPKVTTHGFPMVLDDRPIHKVMNWHQWGKFLSDHAPYKMADSPVIELDLAGSGALLTKKDLTGPEVEDRMRRNVINQVAAQKEPAYEVTHLSRKIGPNDHDAWEDLGDEMESYLLANPDVGYLNVMGAKDDQQVKVYANAEPLKPQVLIFMDDDINPDVPINLIYMGKPHHDQLVHMRHRYVDPVHMVDPPVMVFRAQPHYYRAENPPRAER